MRCWGPDLAEGVSLEEELVKLQLCKNEHSHMNPVDLCEYQTDLALEESVVVPFAWNGIGILEPVLVRKSGLTSSQNCFLRRKQMVRTE